jgi:urease gamma subunit
MNYSMGDFDKTMGFNLTKEINKLKTSVMSDVASKAKATTISTLNDPEFRKTVNDFTREWIKEHKMILGVVAGSFAVLSFLAVLNIVSNSAAIAKKK